jgi:hypothetical protein
VVEIKIQAAETIWEINNLYFESKTIFIWLTKRKISGLSKSNKETYINVGLVSGTY